LHEINSRLLTRIALLIALALIFQSIRFIIPIPVFLSTFVIGSLVNAVLLIAVETVGLWGAAIIAVLTPIVAYVQQMLPLPVFILPIALGNIVYIVIFKIIRKCGIWQCVTLGSFGKTAFLFVSFKWMLSFIILSPNITAGIMFVMSWPQLVTGIVGGFLAVFVAKRIEPIL
jgi:uncharacterized membrane protein